MLEDRLDPDCDVSPWNSLPTFLKEPMLAMSFLLGCFEPATVAASMAIGRPGTIDDAPAGRGPTARDGVASGPERSGGCRRGDFLASRGMGGPGSRATCRVGWSPGEESRADGVAAQAIEAQPVFGQIKP